jgi:hypothetical protein
MMSEDKELMKFFKSEADKEKHRIEFSSIAQNLNSSDSKALKEFVEEEQSSRGSCLDN